MIISREQIRSMAVDLQSLIARKDYILKYSIETFNTWKEMANLFKCLLESMSRVRPMILNDEKELSEIKTKCTEFSKQERIDTTSPQSGKLAIMFLEIQAILRSSSESSTLTLIESVRSNLRKVEKLISNTENNLDSSKKSIYDSIISVAENNKISDSKILFKHTERTPKNLRLSNLTKDSLRNQGGFLSHARNSEINLYKFKNIKLNETFKDDGTDLHKLLSKAIIEGEDLIKQNKIQMSRNIAQIKAKSYKVPQNLDKCNSRNGNKEKIKTYANNAFKQKLKNINEEKKISDIEINHCSACRRTGTSIVRAKCCGKICLNCLKQRIINHDPRIFLNSFEADKRQLSMCVCPIHKSPIDTKLLQFIFNSNEIERISIDAIKREKKEKKERIKKIQYPTICMTCKRTINDDSKNILICSKHKICSDCSL